MALTSTWIDHGREPQCPPNPAHPLGVDLDISGGATTTCQSALPWPAPRCGVHVVECNRCNQRIVVTTAGRPDDPRSIKVACKLSELKL